jgi:HEAT repeat protein
MNRIRFVAIRKLTLALVAIAAYGGSRHALAQDAQAQKSARSLIESVRADNVDVRRKAATDIEMSDHGVQRQALPIMIEVLAKEKDGQVRLAVLGALATMGPDAAPAVSALVHTLETDFGGQGSEASHQDYRSALALAAIGKPAVDGLRGLLKARKAGVRAEVVMALGRIGADARAAVPDLIGLLGDKNERMRSEISLALGHIGPASVEPLIAACGHNDAFIRAGAVESLGYLVEPNLNVKHVALERAHDGSPVVRASAVKALAKLSLADDAILPILTENIHHDDDQVRLAVVNLLVGRRQLLSRMGPELESLLTAKNDRVSRHAAYLLGRSGPDAASRLLNALRQDSSRIDQIADALAQIGRPAAAALAAGVSSPDPRVRRGAALALGQIRPIAPGIVQKLTAGLLDPDLAVKTAFLTAVGSLGSRASQSVPTVRALLNHQSAEIRMQAIHILSQSAPRDQRLVADLIALVDDKDARVQREAIDILRSLGPLGRPALAAVIGRLKSTDPDVRFAAADMIGSHGPAAVEAVPALCTLLDDPAPKIRTIAARTLGTMGKGAQPSMTRLASLLGADQVEVREAAISTLGALELDPDQIRPHLARALRDDKTEVRRAALKSIQRFGPQGAIFVPDIILMAENKDNLRSVERTLRRFERAGPDVRSLPELIKQLDNKQEAVRRLAIKFLALAGQDAKGALPALERLRQDPSAEIRKQAETASELIKKNSAGSKRDLSPA